MPEDPQPLQTLSRFIPRLPWMWPRLTPRLLRTPSLAPCRSQDRGSHRHFRGRATAAAEVTVGKTLANAAYAIAGHRDWNHSCYRHHCRQNLDSEGRFRGQEYGCHGCRIGRTRAAAKSTKAGRKATQVEPRPLRSQRQTPAAADAAQLSCGRYPNQDRGRSGHC